MRQADWYFDFISPFAYLQFTRLQALRTDLRFTLRPVLFAGLLAHHGQLGPAEIPGKRRFTYRFVQWYARARGVAFRMPEAHPFNPLLALRLCAGLGAEHATVGAVFAMIWAEGIRPDTEQGRRRLLECLAIDEAGSAQAIERGRSVLQDNYQRAIAAGVFGVPTVVIDGRLFWGLDATDMLIDYLRDPVAFEDEEMGRVSELPEGVHRRRPGPSED